MTTATASRSEPVALTASLAARMLTIAAARQRMRPHGPLPAPLVLALEPVPANRRYVGAGTWLRRPNWKHDQGSRS